jgi:hypothetical protein
VIFFSPDKGRNHLMVMMMMMMMMVMMVMMMMVMMMMMFTLKILQRGCHKI